MRNPWRNQQGAFSPTARLKIAVGYQIINEPTRPKLFKILQTGIGVHYIWIYWPMKISIPLFFYWSAIKFSSSGQLNGCNVRVRRRLTINHFYEVMIDSNKPISLQRTKKEKIQEHDTKHDISCTFIYSALSVFKFLVQMHVSRKFQNLFVCLLCYVFKTFWHSKVIIPLSMLVG